MPEMSGPTAPDDASFTLPARPGVRLLEHPRVDLLAGESPRRHLPEGTVAGSAVLGALVLFSSLVGGLTAAFVVVGVSTLLAASAALVTGDLSVGQAGGQRGAGLLLGVGAAALILGSLVSENDRPAPEYAAGTPVPVDARSSVQPPRPYAAATATPARSAQVAGASASPTVSTESAAAAGLTLSPEALAPRPDGGAGNATGTGTGDPRPKASERGTGKAGAATVSAVAKASDAKPAKPVKPVKADKAARAATTTTTTTTTTKTKPPVVVRHGVAVVSSAVRDLL